MAKAMAHAAGVLLTADSADSRLSAAQHCPVAVSENTVLGGHLHGHGPDPNRAEPDGFGLTHRDRGSQTLSPTGECTRLTSPVARPDGDESLRSGRLHDHHSTWVHTASRASSLHRLLSLCPHPCRNWQSKRWCFGAFEIRQTVISAAQSVTGAANLFSRSTSQLWMPPSSVKSTRTLRTWWTVLQPCRSATLPPVGKRLTWISTNRTDWVYDPQAFQRATSVPPAARAHVPSAPRSLSLISIRVGSV